MTLCKICKKNVNQSFIPQCANKACLINNNNKCLLCIDTTKLTRCGDDMIDKIKPDSIIFIGESKLVYLCKLCKKIMDV